MVTGHAGQRGFLGFLFGKLLCQQLFPFKSIGHNYTAQGLSIAMHIFPLMNNTFLLRRGMLSGQSSVKRDEAQL